MKNLNNVAENSHTCILGKNLKFCIKKIKDFLRKKSRIQVFHFILILLKMYSNLILVRIILYLVGPQRRYSILLI